MAKEKIDETTLEEESVKIDELLPEIASEEEKEGKKQARQWCLTINNPEKTDDELEEFLQGLEHIKYYVFQRERGLETGTLHIQMFIQFKIGKRFSTIKNLFPKAHIESARGTGAENQAYCTKSETKVGEKREWGELTSQGGRRDLKEFYDFVDSGATNSQIRKHFGDYYLKYYNKLGQIRQDMLREKRGALYKENFLTVFIHGKSRTGKTTSLFEHYRNEAYFIRDYDNYMWDNYENQDVVVFDRFHSQVNFDMMVNYLEPIPLDLGRRYSNMFGNFNTVFILSNEMLEKQYSFEKSKNYDTWSGFYDRINFVIELTREKAYIEKISDNVSIEDLKRVLPTNLFEKLDYSKMPGKIAFERVEQVKKYEVTPDDELPF